MKRLITILAALLAVVITSRAQDALNIQLGQTLYVRAAQGEEKEEGIAHLISALGYSKDKMNGMTFHLVKDLSLLTKDNYNILFDNTDNCEKLFFENDGNAAPSHFPVTLQRSVTFQNNTQNVSFFSLQLTYEGATREGMHDFYLVSDLSAWNEQGNVFDIKGIAIPIHLETYNSFRYLDYPSAAQQLGDFVRGSWQQLYMAKATSPYAMAGKAMLSGNDWLASGTEDANVQLFQAFSSASLAKACAINIVEHNGSYCLADADGKIYAVSDNSQTTLAYSLHAVDADNLGEYHPLVVTPLDATSCIVKAEWQSRVDASKTNRVYLDYNAGRFELIATTTAADAAHALLLYHEVVREDCTPHFMPYDGQVTSFNGQGDAGETEIERTTDPLTIEMTFDRPLQTDPTTGEVLDIEGKPLSKSEYFTVYIDELTTQPTTRAAIRKAPRPVLVSSTSVKSATQSNVAVVKLNPQSFSTASNVRAEGPMKAPRPVLVSSTSVKVVAKAGAIKYSTSTSSGSKRRANSLAEETATTAFAFEYTISNNDDDYSITTGTRVDITVGEGGIMTYNATQGEWLDAGSTSQLKFYKVSGLAVGTVTLEQLHGVVCGPVMVAGKPGRTVTVDKTENGTEADPSNFLRYCDEYNSTIPYWYDGMYYPEDYDRPSTAPQAYNYLFGRPKSPAGSPLGFYHLNITSENGWQNNTGHGIVYLHSYMNLAPSGTNRVRMVLPDGEEIGAPTGIQEICADGTRNGNGRLYNTLGQEVKGGYRGIVISGSKKYINK